VRHVTALPARQVQAYTSADLTFGWRVSNNLRLSVSGTNLLSAAHAEFGHDPGPIVSVRRAFTLSAAWTSR
jgi:hypothetical protein